MSFLKRHWLRAKVRILVRDLVLNAVAQNKRMRLLLPKPNGIVLYVPAMNY